LHHFRSRPRQPTKSSCLSSGQVGHFSRQRQ
jgi:hypothetical protein